MADKGQVQTAQGQPLMKIGYYILGETLGVGTFGKVKSKFCLEFVLKYDSAYFHIIDVLVYMAMCVLICKQ